MSDLNSFDSSADQASSSKQLPLSVLDTPVIMEAPEASMLTQSELPVDIPFASLLMNWQMQQFLLAQLMAQAAQAPIGPNYIPQQSTPRRAYLKRKRETPTPQRQAAATTPAQASEPSEAFPEVNFNDHSAYNRLLSSVWDFKGAAPWSRYSVQQVMHVQCTVTARTVTARQFMTPQQLSDIVKTPSSWAPEWDGQVKFGP
jgi:hypothetical protein